MVNNRNNRKFKGKFRRALERVRSLEISSQPTAARSNEISQMRRNTTHTTTRMSPRTSSNRASYNTRTTTRTTSNTTPRNARPVTHRTRTTTRTTSNTTARNARPVTHRTRTTTRTTSNTTPRNARPVTHRTRTTAIITSSTPPRTQKTTRTTSKTTTTRTTTRIESRVTKQGSRTYSLKIEYYEKFKPKAGIITLENFKCIFCYQLPKLPEDANRGIILCPHCGHPAHADEFKDWLKISSLCSRCGSLIPPDFCQNPKIIPTELYIKAIKALSKMKYFQK